MIGTRKRKVMRLLIIIYNDNITILQLVIIHQKFRNPNNQSQGKVPIYLISDYILTIIMKLCIFVKGFKLW